MKNKIGDRNSPAADFSFKRVAYMLKSEPFSGEQAVRLVGIAVPSAFATRDAIHQTSASSSFKVLPDSVIQAVLPLADPNTQKPAAAEGDNVCQVLQIQKSDNSVILPG